MRFWLNLAAWLCAATCLMNVAISIAGLFVTLRHPAPDSVIYMGMAMLLACEARRQE